MASLNWIGKEAVANHDKDVPFKLLKKVKTASVGDKSENLIVHGDNLEALKALMPYYQDKVKCIYIDPPYNTGNEGWVYNDKVNSPKIKDWLGKVVGKESEDLTMHDKWLCMMYPRIALAKELLKEDGVIFISIDDNEYSNLRLLLDEVFGKKNFISTIVVNTNPRGRSLDKHFAKTFEYIVVYGKDASKMSSIHEVLKSEKALKEYNKEDDKGKYRLLELRNRNPVFNRKNRPNLYYPIFINPNTGGISTKKVSTFTEQALPKNSKGEDGCWTWSKDKAEKEKNMLFGRKTKTGIWRVFRKDYSPKDGAKTKEKSLWTETYVNHEYGKEEMARLFDTSGSSIPFDFPKSVELIKRVVNVATKKDAGDIVLDSFAGSGTTGQAVLDLNKEDSGNRKFILVEMEDHVARDVTAERVKRAIKKYSYADGFEYCELDKPLFNENGQIDDSCEFKQLATYVYFTETQTNIDAKKIAGNFIGDNAETEYYLIYKGRNRNDLDKSFLKNLKKTNNKKVVYADRCFLDEKILEKHGIEFKQIPYEVKVY